MKQKKFNIIMVVFSFIGGILSWIIGEAILEKLTYTLPDSVIIGLYFGVFALIVGAFCLVAEYIRPEINGMLWRNNYYGMSFKYLFLSTFLGLFLTAFIFQLIYGMNIGHIKKINDVVILIDMSGSMRETDPNNERLEAAKQLVAGMNEENRISMFVFNDNITKVQDMTEVTNSVKNDISSNIDKFKNPDGNTNIKGALNEGIKNIEDTAQNQRAAMVILLSDGEDTYGLKNSFNDTIKAYKDRKIPVYTIGMNKSDFSLLKKLSRITGGNYYSVYDAKNVRGIFNKIYKERDRRLLIDNRNGMSESSAIYAVLRIILVALLGALIGLSVALTFDNRYTVKSFIIGGAFGGIAAGIILEVGFKLLPWYGEAHRLFADIALAIVFTTIRVRIPIDDDKDNIKGFNKRKLLKVKSTNGLRGNSREAFH